MGSRPIARMARTGEFTPPGSTAAARRYSSADRVSLSEDGALTSGRVLRLPAAEVVGEVEHPHLLELRGGVEGRAVADARVRGDRVEHGVALLLGAPVGHGEHGVRPVGI